VNDTPDPERDSRLAPGASPPASNRRVIVASGDHDLGRVICERLEKAGLNAVGVLSGADAIAVAEQSPSCLLVLDQILPDMVARRVVAELAARGRQVPFIVMTGSGDELVAVDMMKLGARDYIVKQADFIELFAPVVRHALAQVATEERLAASERALRESEQQLRTITDTASDAIVMMDDSGCVTFWNPAAEATFGYAATEALGRRLHEFFAPERFRAAHHAAFGRFPATGEGRAVNKTVELAAIRKDGTEIAAELSLSTIKLGDKWHGVGIVRDITERKRAEEALRAAFAEIRTLKEQLEAENVILREEVKLSHVHGDIVGESQAIKRTLALAEQVASTDSTVVIYGETGTGKELLARSIHNLSKRRDRPLVTVNCAAMPATLIEAELFGREKGAYTGAATRQAGRFEVADRGTIFLDEVGELSPEAQAKLLRVLQEGKFERLGSTNTLTADVRVIAATNRNLEQAVRNGRFREDLFYRLNVFPITVPPLRERREDIPLLVWTFVREFGEKMGKRIETIPRTTLEALCGNPWPGNVRALRNTIERAMILSSGTALQAEVKDVAPGAADLTVDDAAERARITRALEASGWRIRGAGGAAEQVGLKPTTLEYRMKRLGIRRPREKDS